MSIRGKIEDNKEKLEKIAFIVVFLFSILQSFLADESIVLAVFSIIGLVFLWGVYISTGKTDFFKLPILLLLGYPISRLLVVFSIAEASYIQYVYFAGLVLYGIYTIIDTFKMSIQNKNFELLNFLMGVFLLIAPLAILYGNDLLEKGGDYYFYGLAFVLATIMYNDNLWERNGYNGKSLIKYVFAITILTILDSSLKAISF
jgi:hypothetical protein